jgi:hypothetical protein
MMELLVALLALAVARVFVLCVLVFWGFRAAW